MPNGYKNLTWINASVIKNVTRNGGYMTGVVSGHNSIYNGNGNPMTIKSDISNLMTLHSFAIAAAWHDNLKLEVVGYKSNISTITTTFTLHVFNLSYLKFHEYKVAVVHTLRWIIFV